MESSQVVCARVFESQNVHVCKNLIIFCSDFRFDYGNRKLRRAERIHWADEIKIPGGIKHIVDRRLYMLDWINFFYKEHKTEIIYLVAHANCGWYARQGIVFYGKHDEEREQEFYAGQLREARDVIKSLLPEAVQVELRYARLAENQGLIKNIKIEYVRVD